MLTLDSVLAHLRPASNQSNGADHELLLAEREHDMLETRSEELDKVVSASLVVCALVVAADATILASFGAAEAPALVWSLMLASVAVIATFVAAFVRTRQDETIAPIYDPKIHAVGQVTSPRELLLRRLRARANALRNQIARRRGWLYVSYAAVLSALLGLVGGVALSLL
ncbi:hypothetical protein IFT90_00655 [Frigoribacterium sp. CFBP 8766]|uniref:hypothetical protein n=1 Tax=Frigoribacterium sp. CFBP 8766 TaxID=2775273 RepID=UPI001780C69A|nr:hypothetical protein [Frigoribacterium sp. CFBP 8766]MBD8583059.1 hypothetical protein [Frigoribacterium sp. CFBP 8766]